jgi:hypothetical protein
MALNQFEAGFQSNTTIHAAFWIYKPDFSFDPHGKEVMINVNNLQYIEVDQPTIRMSQITNIAINAGVLTVTGNNSFQANMNAALINGLQNATFLNGKIVPVSTATGTAFTAALPTITAPISSVEVSSDVLTITARQNWVVGMTVTFSGLVNATFLNGQTVTITSVSQNFSDPSGYASFTAAFTNADYGTAGCGSGNDIGLATLNTNGYSAADSGTVTDPSARKVWLFYGETNVSTSQHPRELIGVAAQAFITDMEALFG